jgi:hypothetical protein
MIDALVWLAYFALLMVVASLGTEAIYLTAEALF